MGSVVSNATKSARLVRPVAVWTLRPTNGTVSLFSPYLFRSHFHPLALLFSLPRSSKASHSLAVSSPTNEWPCNRMPIDHRGMWVGRANRIDQQPAVDRFA